MSEQSGGGGIASNIDSALDNLIDTGQELVNKGVAGAQGLVDSAQELKSAGVQGLEQQGGNVANLVTNLVQAFARVAKETTGG